MKWSNKSTWWLAPLGAFAVLLCTASAEAQSPVKVVRVVESWQLVVSQPDPSLDAPQVTSVISPVGHLDSLYAAFEVNHQSQPAFVGGGMQLQLWNGETPLVSKKHKEGQKLAHDNETISWVHDMYLKDGVLYFQVRNGASTTWGNFGGPLSTAASVATTLEDLNGYSPLVGVENSGVGYAGNRVTSLKLMSVKVYTSDGQVVEDSTVRVAFPKQ
jgi:hypothetical protein